MRHPISIFFAVTIIPMVAPANLEAASLTLLDLTKNVEVADMCTVSRSYQDSYTCPKGTRKNSTCYVYTDSTGAKCRETCEPKTCGSDE